MRDDVMQIFRERVVVVSAGGLARFAEAASVVSNHTMTRVQQRRNLFFPRRTAQGISMNQNHRRAGTMIFIVEADGRRVFFSNFDVRHARTSLGSSGRMKLLSYRWCTHKARFN